ncbi:forkhead box protein H1-like [Myxocyprinus asiaticus]|uniref:forkhead box protein H1-like n=1 Tax=Myxocyprinus asiaticus TaxID=70543 RepID=UPI0022238D0A|nr:forkhead box protein H1-like [Myxocyprinus asiaticus]
MQSENTDMLNRRKYRRYSKQKMTYLALIAYVIQNAPDKRLTFCELMNTMTTFVDGDRKGLENNIRVCLSSNDCFVKVPRNPECPNAKRNFWKMDDRKITPKMLRRHFSSVRDAFPDFYDNLGILSLKTATAQTPTCNATESQKFTSPFSIESLLQRESSTPSSQRPVHVPHFTDVCPGVANEDQDLSYKRKTWDYPSEIDCANFSRSYSHFYAPYNSVYSHWRVVQRMCSVSELAYHASDSSLQIL